MAVADTISTLPDVLRQPAGRWFERLESLHGHPDLPADTLERLVRLVASSDYAGTVLHRDWDWFMAAHTTLDDAPDVAALEQLVLDVAADEDIDAACQRIRRFRHRWMVQLLWRETGGVAALEDTLGSLSLLADRLLDAAARFATRAVEERCGQVLDDDGNPAPLVILGMGKLGGGELNFSSDIDIVFLYPAGRESNGRKCVGAQDYFTRVSHQIVALLDEATADGFAFRVDTRLRPFGDSGPPVTSFAALEAYLIQHGRDWERYAYVKARIVGPAPPARVANELQQDIITPFVYRRYLDYGVFESLREMHGMIAAEVVRKDMADNIKLGPGGIREIEFIVQSLQLVRGGSRPELQRRGLLRVLPLLAGRRGLSEDAAAALGAAYRYLRRLENFIQAIRDRQTHELPDDEADRARLCVAMGHDDWGALLAELDGHRDRVTREFEAVAFRSEESGAAPAGGIEKLWQARAGAADWAAVLRDEGYPSADDLAEKMAAFAADPATRQVDAVAAERLRTFVPSLLAAIRESDEPGTALARVLTLVDSILRRSAYLALLNENRNVLAQLVALCEKSGYIADQVARYPVLLDELIDPSVRSSPLTLDELEAELRERLAECPDDDSEMQMAVIGKFQRATQFRIAIADFSGSLPIMKVSDSLTWLAEAVLRTSLDIAWRDLVARHGEPGVERDGERQAAGFAIIAYGKLGGLEMSYGSDLDLVFLHDATGNDGMTDGAKPLDNAVFFTRLVRRLSHFLTAQTGSGMLYEVDTRLRPDGKSGVMVSSVEAFERYQVDNAWTWEHQALLRARPVAGSERIAAEFQRVRAETLATRVRRDSLRAEVQKMRRRMRKELDRSNASEFDLKQGRGGIADIEFIVQYLVLDAAAEHASVYYWSDNIRQLDALADAGIVAADEAAMLQDIYRAYRQRVHHLALDNDKPRVPQDAFVDERGFVEKLWQRVFGGL